MSATAQKSAPRSSQRRRIEREPGSSDVMTVPEAAKLLRVGRNAIYDAIGRNAIPHVRIGRLVRFSKAALLAWMGAPDRANLDPCSLQVAKEDS